ncbi:MAG TPA: hypothetical protein VHK88_20095 [Aquihabitans sp.]|jgi:hypothetical protein|nr:hypothetical protein [Aquihabitans sp.]
MILTDEEKETARTIARVARLAGVDDGTAWAIGQVAAEVLRPSPTEDPT